MGVIFKGGTSGNRADAKPPVPDSGTSQPVVDTASSGGVPGTIQMPGGTSGNRESSLPTMPTGGSSPDLDLSTESPLSEKVTWIAGG